MFRFASIILILTVCGCAHTQPHLTLAHDIRVPKEWRGGASDPVFRDSSNISRYISAYERGWWWCVVKHARDIDFQPACSDGFISGWPAETYGWTAGVDDAQARIKQLIQACGKQTVSGLLADFKAVKLDDDDTNTPSPQTVASLNATANDTAATPDERCNAIFSLFRHFIKPGSTAPEIHSVLTDTRWLEQTNIHGIYLLGGMIPVDCDFRHETPFVVSVLPALKPSGGWPPNAGYCIYFTLGGGASRSRESAYAVLTGLQSVDTNAVLKEFALCYPDGTVEHIRKWGTRRFNFSQRSMESAGPSN